jgi:hypothetical protein
MPRHLALNVLRSFGQQPVNKQRAMKKTLIKAIVLLTMLLGLPMAGILLAGRPVSVYLEFPPKTIYVQETPFSWLAFVAYSLFILAILSPLVIHGLGKNCGVQSKKPSAGFPWWGWLGLFFGTAAWIFAWTRFPWFEPFQPYTFTPLWVAYIVILNALTYRRAGSCLMLDQPLPFLFLFPVSAAFWWFFEYLNRFVQNWYYTGPEFGPVEYFLYATFCFSTVLPAFASTREWLLSFPRIEKSFQGFPSLRVSRPRCLAGLVLIAAGTGLLLLGLLPHHLFPLLWISPLLVLVSLQALLQEDHLFKALTHGDWTLVLISALSAVICGFFWEMWNYWSLAKWIYRIPFVHRFQIFEMPLLGYAGYLPFGVECAVIVGMIIPFSLPSSRPICRGERFPPQSGR